MLGVVLQLPVKIRGQFIGANRAAQLIEELAQLFELFSQSLNVTIFFVKPCRAYLPIIFDRIHVQKG